MKRILCLLSLILFQQHSSAQFQIDWQNCFIGPGSDRVNDLIALEDGYFILGTYNSVDVWLIKTDLNGNFLWDRKYGGSQNDFGKRILRANDGNYLIVALSASKDFDLTGNPYPNSANYWIYKINPSGNIIWSKVVGGNGPDWPNWATLTHDGGVVAVGQSQSFDGDVDINYGYWDIWAVKLDADGNKVWSEVFGSDGAEWADEVITDTDGSVLIGGTTANEGYGNIDCDPYNEWGESLIMKFDSNMNLLWQQCYGGSNHEVVASITPSTNGYFSNHYAESNDGDLTNSGYHGATDSWMTKLDINGNFIWGKCYGGSTYEAPFKIFQLDNSDILQFNVTYSNDGDVSGNHSQGSDIWIVKSDSNGIIKWQQCIGGNNDESSIAVAQISDQTYVVASMTLSFVSGDVECNTTIQTGYNIWFFQITDTTTVSRKEDRFSRLKVYPNPADDFLFIQDDNHGEKYFTLTNLFGVKLISDVGFSNELYVDLQSYKPGLYIYSVKDQEGNFTSGKLLIQ